MSNAHPVSTKGAHKVVASVVVCVHFNKEEKNDVVIRDEAPDVIVRGFLM